MDGAMTNAPHGGTKVGMYPTDHGQIGTKRSVVTDGGGVSIGLAVEGANGHDFKMVEETTTSIPVERPVSTLEQPQGVCLDKGDDDDEVRKLLAQFGFTPTSGHGARKPKPSRVKQGTGHVDGWCR